MLVCENHRDKRWPDECDCGPGMDPAVFADARILRDDEGRTYIIRDVWSDGGHAYKPGLNLLHCQYAVVRDDVLQWRACLEGASFGDIEPYSGAYEVTKEMLRG